MTKIENTFNLANAHVIRTETKHLNTLLGRYQELQGQKGSDAQLDIVLGLIAKEKARLSTCDKYDEEEVAIAILIKKRRQNGRT